jgi:hypothetical protein
MMMRRKKMSALKNFGKKVWLFFKKLKDKIWVFLKSLKNLRLVILEKEKMELPEDSFNLNSIMGRIIFKIPSQESVFYYEAVIHFPIEISESTHERFCRPLRDSSETYLLKVGKIGRKIIKGLFTIRGITEVAIKPYQLILEKGECFSWDKDIMPKVKKVIRRALQ